VLARHNNERMTSQKQSARLREDGCLHRESHISLFEHNEFTGQQTDCMVSLNESHEPHKRRCGSLQRCVTTLMP
jgi:hypothetical protein